MKKAVLLVTKLTLAMLLFTGCGPAYKDVTASPRFNFSSFAGTTWKAKVDLAIADIKNYTGRHELCLLGPKYFDVKDPEYTPVENCKIIAIMPVGTHLQIGRLMQDNGGEWGGVKVLSTIQNGNNSQKGVFLNRELLAKNSFITEGASPSTNWSVNPEMLESVIDDSKK